MKILGEQYASCKLCQTHGKLCKSHIVPEFCYSYEESGSSRYGLEILAPADNGKPITRKFQKGYREYLLCHKCEQVICNYETPFSSFWKNSVLSNAPFTAEKGFEVHDIDYHSTKMFLLSVFWRASVSQGFGQAMELGPYSDKLRQVLLNNSHVPQTQYPFIGTMILDDLGKPFHGCVTQPFLKRYDQVRIYAMHFCGCEWAIIMSDHYIPKDLQVFQQVVGENGKLYLLTQHYTQDSFFHLLSQKLRSN